uniref:G-protein coupled receptors family 1 profile domain-containing protein n=1 Tax=Leptobrachium leishanense TaxID=445787 RepID=A0A8C5MKX7_9ANUR
MQDRKTWSSHSVSAYSSASNFFISTHDLTSIMLSLEVINQTGIFFSAFNETVDLEMKFSEDIKTLIGVALSILIFFMVSGNILVILAFVADKRLRTQSNLFLLNLAICDFGIGAFSTPLFLPYMLTGKWMPGRIMCKLWLTIDYTMCTASAFNVVLISYDRFMCVTNAVLYRSQQNNQNLAILKMIVVWIASFLLYGPVILFGDIIFGGHIPDTVCLTNFLEIWYVHFGTSIFDFAFPLISISFFNLSIYWNIKKRSKSKKHPSVPHHLQAEHKRPYIIVTDIVLFGSQLHRNENEFPSLSANSRLNTNDVQIIQLSKDKKVAKSLLILVCVFAICWAPYTFLITIGKACSGRCIESHWYDITIWLLYANSAINPILYPLCHKSFRNAFYMMFKMCINKRDY